MLRTNLLSKLDKMEKDIDKHIKIQQLKRELQAKYDEVTQALKDNKRLTGEYIELYKQYNELTGRIIE